MVTERLLRIAEKTVQCAMRQNVDQAQASAFLLDTALTRFANSQIHQNVATKKGGVLIKVVLNKQVSTTRVNTLEEEQIENAVIQAVKIAKASKAYLRQSLGPLSKEFSTRKRLIVRLCTERKRLKKPLKRHTQNRQL